MKLFYIAFLLSISVSGFGQGFEVSDQSNFSGMIGEEIEGSLAIRNISEETILLGIRRLSSTISTGQKTWFCLNNNCLDPQANELSSSIQIAPGETFTGFKSILAAGLGQGFSIVKYLIYDKNNPDSYSEVEVNYSISDKAEIKALFSSRKLIINDIYPNPVSDFAIVDYVLLDKESTAKIVIHSVLGSIIGEYNLQPLETHLKIKADAFNPGVYFYTLYIENDGVMTRKLIVR